MMATAKTIEAVHTHTHTHTIQLEDRIIASFLVPNLINRKIINRVNNIF